MLSRNLENSAKGLQPKEGSRMDHLQHSKEGLLKPASVERTTYLRTVITSTSQNDQTIGNQVIRSKKQIEEKLENNSRLQDAIEKYCENPPNKNIGTKE